MKHIARLVSAIIGELEDAVERGETISGRWVIKQLRLVLTELVEADGR